MTYRGDFGAFNRNFRSRVALCVKPGDEILKPGAYRNRQFVNQGVKFIVSLSAVLIVVECHNKLLHGLFSGQKSINFRIESISPGMFLRGQNIQNNVLSRSQEFRELFKDKPK